MRPLSDESAPGAVILAAGLGRRLGGRPKAALHIGEQSLLERLAGVLREAGVSQPRVVLGPYREILLPLALRAGLDPLLHEQDDPSLVDSQRLAVQVHHRLQPERPLWLLLGDLTALSVEDLRRLKEAWRNRAPDVQALLPAVAGQRGHPVILGPQAVDAIDEQPANLGVRHWLSAHEDRVHFEALPGPGPVQDLDTEADLLALRAAHHPTPVDWR
ncbi:NTP transferase domain-containing protein [Mitsuaria sp. WAJ17]|uniref:nucleotidyltransferase family protein n=1 Tax=Mitsuaria sp. WAJ17 TaxID=2761452 RepID=UPI0016038217|nr:NTP transferase domain-containing protein [Mitsuaria sp. WAJ17]MBB2484567.1 NTP transferase domain-containing protein [Mitsuaria sp. WAJ17]